MKEIEQLLRQRIGLDAAALGPSVLGRAVRQRISALKLDGVHDYRALLAAAGAEWDVLVEEVVVAETWFFRDRQAFGALSRLALARTSPAPLRLLSVPCASGEEPYSMVMALLDAGLPPARFQVDALDISSRALARARRAIYGRNSFRGEDLSYRDRYFHAVKDGYALNPTVRERVCFRRGNLLDAEVLAGTQPYDFVFCRNLLIYFDRATQRRAFAVLERLVSERGHLFVGPAELPLVSRHGFISARMPMAFACQKAFPVRRLTAERSRLNLACPGPATPTSPLKSRPRRSAITSSRSTNASEEDALKLAQQLADAGRLHEAALACHEILQRQSDSAQAYYLLGLIADAQGFVGAGGFYRKAIYLDPHHYEALTQMSLLCAKQGNEAQARVFSRRADRVRNHD